MGITELTEWLSMLGVRGRKRLKVVVEAPLSEAKRSCHCIMHRSTKRRRSLMPFMMRTSRSARSIRLRCRDHR